MGRVLLLTPILLSGSAAAQVPIPDPSTVVEVSKAAESLGIIGFLVAALIVVVTGGSFIIRALLNRLDAAYAKLEAANNQLIAIGPQFMERSLTALGEHAAAARQNAAAVEAMVDEMRDARASRDNNTATLSALDRKVEALTAVIQMREIAQRSSGG